MWCVWDMRLFEAGEAGFGVHLGDLGGLGSFHRQIILMQNAVL